MLSPCPFTPTMFTNEHCSRLLGSASSSDFRYEADPSTIFPLKTHTNSSSLHSELSRAPSGPGLCRTGWAELTSHPWESVDENHWETSPINRKGNSCLLFCHFLNTKTQKELNFHLWCGVINEAMREQSDQSLKVKKRMKCICFVCNNRKGTNNSGTTKPHYSVHTTSMESKVLQNWVHTINLLPETESNQAQWIKMYN